MSLFTRVRPAWLRYLLLAILAATAMRAAVVDGVGNFYKVNDHLYRGAQPTDRGFRSLSQLGIRTVLDLRIPEERSNQEEKIVKSLGMRYVHLPMNGSQYPTDAEIQKALSVLDDRSAWPIFVHCREGKDRTGAVIACDRIAREGWTNTRALAEAKSRGMHRSKHGLGRLY
jgi:tyrosine-protein phosphatase SIW14